MPKRHHAETIRRIFCTHVLASFQLLKIGLISSMLFFNVGSYKLKVI